MSSAPPPTGPPRTPRPTPRERRQRRTVIVVAAIAVLALVGGLAIGSQLGRDREPGATDDPGTASPTVTEEPSTPSDPPTDGDDPGGDAPGSEEPLTAIPDDLAIDAGLRALSELEVTGPGRDVDEAELAVCDQQLWPQDSPVDRLAASGAAPERFEVREVATFSDADVAVAALEGMRGALAGCETFTTDAGEVAVGTPDADTGYDTVTVSLTAASGQPGGTVHQLVRVGNAVLATASDGELTSESVPGVVERLTEENRGTAAQLCVFTEAGC